MNNFDEYGDPIRDDNEESALALGEDGKLVLKRKPDMGPPVSAAPVTTQYNRIAADNSAIDRARKSADDRKMVSSIIEGLSTAFAGAKNTDSSFYKGLRDAANADVKSAEAAKERKLSELLTGNKLNQDTQKFGWEQADNDPNSAKSIASRGLLAKQAGVDAKMFEGMGFADQLKVAQAFKKAKAEGKQMKAIETPTGQVEWGVFDPETGKFVSTGIKVGYKMGFDPTTGTQISGATKGDTAVPVTTASGAPLADVRTGLESTRAGGKARATEGVKADVEAAKADATVEKKGDLADRWMGLYDAAAKEGSIVPGVDAVGPVGGRISVLKNDMGMSNGPATDALIASMQQEGNQYIHDMTGAQGSNPEYQRLLRTMPRPTQDRDLFQSRLKEWQEEVKRTAVKMHSAADKINNRTDGTEPAPQTPPAPKYTPEEEAMIDQYMQDPAYKGRSRDQIISAMKKQKLLK